MAPAGRRAAIAPDFSSLRSLVHRMRLELAARRRVPVTRASFDPVTGLLRQFKRGNEAVALTNGPRLVFEKPQVAPTTWLALDSADEMAAMHRLVTAQMANLIEVDLALDKADSYAGFKLEISADSQTWKTIYNSTRRGGDVRHNGKQRPGIGTTRFL